VDVPKGQAIVLKVPVALLEKEGNNFVGNPILVANVDENQSGILVSSVVDWKTRGFPLMIEFRVEKTPKKKEFTEVELRPATKEVEKALGPYVKLRFRPGVRDVSAAFRQLIVTGTINEFESSAEFKEIMTAMSPRVFQRPACKDPGRCEDRLYARRQPRENRRLNQLL
jgi:hypothetical protein